MKIQVHLSLALAALLIGVDGLAQSPRTTVTSTEGVVLLRNGQTLEGNVTKTGDYYLVTRGATSELRLPVASVELVCADLETLYQHKVAGLARGSQQDHAALARWCLQHDLIARSADQTLMVFALDPQDRGLDAIERQLLAAAERADEPATETSEAKAVLTQQEVEQAIESLPTGAVQQFVASVQPLLMNRCATSGCHGATSSAEFKLLRPASRQSPSRRMTQRNLVATLGYVDRDHPLQSRLLTASNSPHGGREAIFTEAENHQIQVLAKWVADLANQPVANHPASIAKPPTFLLQTRPNALAELMNAYATAENAPAAVQLANGQPVSPGEEIPPGEYQPRDPFDPEIFNRRFHRDSGGSK